MNAVRRAPAPARGQLTIEAALHIRDLIVSGQVASGEFMRLAPLAERIGASATPVREALLLLTQEGWLTQEPNRGFRVSAIARPDVEDVYFVHSIVAGELAARAARAITDGQLAELSAIDDDVHRRDCADEWPADVVRHSFHDAVYDIAGAPRLAWFVQAASQLFPRPYWARVPGWIDHNRTGHATILTALAERDGDGARTAMTEHIDSARRLLVGHLDASGFWPEKPSG